jgi:hypothetical protein
MPIVGSGPARELDFDAVDCPFAALKGRLLGARALKRKFLVAKGGPVGLRFARQPVKTNGIV